MKDRQVACLMGKQPAREEGRADLLIHTPRHLFRGPARVLNFSGRGRIGRIGHSVNVSESEQRELRQPRAFACHSLCPATVYFLPPPHPLCPALFHPSDIVFYLHLTVAWGEIAHPLIAMARLGFMVLSYFSLLRPGSTNILSVTRYSLSLTK